MSRPNSARIGGRILGPIEPLEHPASGIRVGRGGRVEPRFEGSGKGRARRQCRLQRPFLRHQSGAELADHLLAKRRAPADLCDVESLERELALLRHVVVTLDAILRDECVVIGSGAGTWRLLRGGGEAHSQRQGAAKQPCDEKRQGKPSHRSHG